MSIELINEYGQVVHTVADSDCAYISGDYDNVTEVHSYVVICKIKHDDFNHVLAKATHFRDPDVEVYPPIESIARGFNDVVHIFGQLTNEQILYTKLGGHL